MKVQVIPKLFIVIMTIAVMLFLIWYFWPRHVKLELVGCIQNPNVCVNEDTPDFYSELHWWFIKSDSDLRDTPQLGITSPQITSLSPQEIENWGMNFDEFGVDFRKNNVILSFSREIKEMKFKSTAGFPYQSISTVKTVMSKEFQPNTIYVYIIPKYEMREDLRAYSETSIEQ